MTLLPKYPVARPDSNLLEILDELASNSDSYHALCEDEPQVLHMRQVDTRNE